MFKSIMALVFLVLAVGPASAGPEEDAIAAVMKGTWDKPGAAVVVSPVAISGDYAIAGWTQEDMGGRALLRRQHGSWVIVLCAGDDLLKAGALKLAGLAAAPAAELLARTAAAEAAIPAPRRAQFSKFEGMVTMDASGSHPPRGASGHQTHK